MGRQVRAVLGIDAAWTTTQPSGVALVVHDGKGWRLEMACASYDHFLAWSNGISLTDRPRGCAPDIIALITAVERRLGVRPDLIAMDMPLAKGPIIGRREADNAVSRAYGARHCGTHSPSAERPGPISDQLRAAAEQAGYRLLIDQVVLPGLAEVYPHPALVELLRADKRLPYKVSRAASYWPELTGVARWSALRGQWAHIVAALDGVVSGCCQLLPIPPEETRAMDRKAFEDMLDAVICGWIGACMIDGKARGYGAGDAAIWVPTPLDDVH
jgi:predicted RNase H-like nuclease